MTTLPAKGTDAGAETRLLLAECKGPLFPGYNLSSATNCMQLMDLVLWNRVANPGPFFAKHATLLAVITAPGQFAGFQHYPHYSSGIAQNLQELVNIANNPKDRRAKVVATFIGAAIQVATGPTIKDPSPGTLAAWRTAGSGSPGADFIPFITSFGTSFYYLKS